MVDTLPLALISVCAFHTIATLSIFGNILQSVLVIWLQTISAGGIIKVASNQ